MNKPVNPLQRGFTIAPERKSEDDFLDLGKLLRMARRQMRWVAMCAAAGLVLALIYLLLAPPAYESSSQILVDQNIGKVVGDVSTLPATIQTDAEILSNTEVLKSIRLALAVVDAQNLTEDEDFLATPPSVSRQILQPVRGTVHWLRDGFRWLFGSTSTDQDSGAATVDDKRLLAAQKLRSDLRAERVGRSFVINVTYKSHNPELAHRLLKATVDAFLVDQQLANIAASQEATKWMRVRLNELERQSREAGLAVERFRSENNLSQARGELVSEQRLAELNNQLILALGQQADAEARAQQMDAIVASGVEAATRNIVSAGAITQAAALDAMRERFADIARREESVTASWGADHPQAVRLRSERESVAAEIYRELQRMAAQYHSEFTVAQNRVATLRNQIETQTGSNTLSNQLVVELNALKQQAESLQTLYGNSLARYEETLQRQSFPITNLRVISPATEPEAASEPAPARTLAMFLFLGAIAGGGIGAMREFGDRTFRVGRDVSRLLGIKFLGYLPNLQDAPADADDTASTAYGQPDSVFSETLHSIRVNLDRQISGASRVVGVISVLPDEGKSVVAGNLAAYLARQGKHTLLINADHSHARINKEADQPDDWIGLTSKANPDWRQTMIVDEPSGLSILPNLAQISDPRAALLSTPDRVAAVLQEARGAFDYIIVDLAPTGPSADAAALQSALDGFILVLAWGSTPIELTKGVLEAEEDLARKIVGGVLDQTDLSALKLYGAKGSDAQAYARYRAHATEPRLTDKYRLKPGWWRRPVAGGAKSWSAVKQVVEQRFPNRVTSK